MPIRRIPKFIPLVRLKQNEHFWRFWNGVNPLAISAIGINYFDLTKKEKLSAKILLNRLKLPTKMKTIMLGITRDNTLFKCNLRKYIESALRIGVELLISLDHSVYAEDSDNFRFIQILECSEKVKKQKEILEQKGVDPYTLLVPMVIGATAKEVDESFRLTVLNEDFEIAAYNAGFWIKSKITNQIFTFLDLCKDHKITPIIINAGRSKAMEFYRYNPDVRIISHFPIFEAIKSRGRKTIREIILEFWKQIGGGTIQISDHLGN
ncbi:MAG: hypothetical protein ACP6IQ_07475 [Candidatus Njordarchaeia archaeon]